MFKRHVGGSQNKGTSLGVPIIRFMEFGVYMEVPSFGETTTFLLALTASLPIQKQATEFWGLAYIQG